MADLTADSETSAPVASKSSLLTIPTETFERIAELSDPQDLLSLRLVSKSAADKTLRTFTQVHFTERAFLLCSEDSLRILLAIAEHAEFGKSMRKVLLCVDQLPERSFIEELEESFISASRHFQSTEETEELRRSFANERLKEQEKDKDCASLLQKQKLFLETRGDLHLLVNIFAQFRGLGKLVDIAIADQSETNMQIAGATQLEIASGRKLHATNLCGNPMRTVVEALVLSALPVESLAIRCGEYLEWSAHLLKITERGVDMARQTFHHCKKLEVHFSEAPWITSEEAQASLESICVAPKLESLSLRYHRGPGTSLPNHDDVMLDRLMRLKYCPELKVLDLQGFTIRISELVYFFKEHAKLVRARFSEVTFQVMYRSQNSISKTNFEVSDTGKITDLLQRVTGVQDLTVESCKAHCVRSAG